MPAITQFVALQPPGEPGARLKVAFSRTGQGFPLLLVHGYTGSKLDFYGQTEGFEDLRTVIAPDLRGHGETDHQQPYDLAQLTYDLLGFLDALQIPRCDLLGHSMGGIVALRAAAQDPTRFRSLLLMDTTAQPLILMESKVAEQLTKLVRQEGCEALFPMMQTGAQSPAIQRGIAHLGNDEYWRRVRLKLSQLDPDAFVDLREAMLASTVDDTELVSIDCPVTIVVGEQDALFRQPAEHLLARLPNASLTVVPFAGHSPQYENHDAWRRCVRAHLEQVAL